MIKGGNDIYKPELFITQWIMMKINVKR
jgi:hypothetical protein